METLPFHVGSSHAAAPGGWSVCRGMANGLHGMKWNWGKKRDAVVRGSD